MSNTAEGTKTAIDALSVFTVVGTLSDLLPPIAALVTIIWTGIRIYETETVQKMLAKSPPKDQDDD